jgi:hypothetical protein
MAEIYERHAVLTPISDFLVYRKHSRIPLALIHHSGGIDDRPSPAKVPVDGDCCPTRLKQNKAPSKVTTPSAVASVAQAKAQRDQARVNPDPHANQWSACNTRIEFWQSSDRFWHELIVGDREVDDTGGDARRRRDAPKSPRNLPLVATVAKLRGK